MGRERGKEKKNVKESSSVDRLGATQFFILGSTYVSAPIFLPENRSIAAGERELHSSGLKKYFVS